ncbi:MAG: hypothetical protein AAFR71_07215 [Pseudomonadota bacterium]
MSKKLFAAALGAAMLFSTAAYAGFCDPEYCEKYPEVCLIMGCGDG